MLAFIIFFSFIVYSNFKLPASDVPYSLISAKFPNDTEPYFVVGSRIVRDSHRKKTTTTRAHFTLSLSCALVHIRLFFQIN